MGPSIFKLVKVPIQDLWMQCILIPGINILRTFEKRPLWFVYTCGVYYKHITIINDDFSIINKFEASLTDDARVIIYDHHMFIVPAIGYSRKVSRSFKTKNILL